MVGFDSRNKNKLQGNYLCSICSLLYRDPVQLGCGHRYCESCIGNPKGIMIKCTQCGEVTLRSQMFLDRGMKNDMMALDISCKLCRWIGLFKDYQGHLSINHLNGSHIKNRAVFEVRRLQEKFNEYSKNVQKLKATVKQMLSDTSSYKISIEEQNPPREIFQENHDSFAPYPGTLLMKIGNIKSRLNGNQSTITSPPFHTSPDGYKMCVHLYLNGSGVGQSTHISIFLILMRGDYDAILKWPFDFQIIFGLYDFTNKTHYIIESFQSNEKSICFQRPRGEMNLPTGLPKFIPLSRIQQDHSPYIFEDSIYIKVMVRKNPIPVSRLANVMNIDHALPIHIQEKMIEMTVFKH